MPILSQLEPIKLTVLCVDDEVNILKSIKRTLHNCDFTVLLAKNALEALDLMEKNEVHLVMSDMKMPQMNGAQFLQQVAKKYPETYRILLTGYSDIESTIAAINLGKIHRYLQKPWSNEELLDVVNSGLNYVKVKLQHTQLLALTKRQNEQLLELNQTLEDKVTLRTKQIKAALSRIEREHSELHSMLFNFISISPGLDGGFAKNVSHLAGLIASEMGLKEQQTEQIKLASLLCEIGLLGLPNTLYSVPFSELNYAEQKKFYEQCDIAREILGPAIHLAPVIDIIASQYEHYNGKGFPQKLVANEIPIGGRILNVARDYWRYLTKRMEPIAFSDREAKQAMNKYRSGVYDPKVLDALQQLTNVEKDDITEGAIRPQNLLPGMVLKSSLFSDKHILILPEGHEFTEATIGKLIHYEKSRGIKLEIYAQ